MFSKKILPVITIGLLAVNCLLIFQNLNLKSKLQSFAPREIKEGSVFPDFDATDLSGNHISMNHDSDSAKKVLLYFHPTCGWCKKQMPYWKELVSKADSSKYKVFLVTTETDPEAIKSYLKNYDIGSWQVLSIKKDVADKADLSGTPTTAVLDETGKVEKVWVGMWRDKELADAGKYFAVNFTPAKMEAKTE